MYNWTVEEAFEQHNGLDSLMKPEDVKEENITEADRVLLGEVKRTEGMEDGERIRVLHCVLGKVLPYLTEAPIRKFGSHEERYKSVGERLVEAYKEYCSDECEKPSKRLVRCFSDLDFSGFSSSDWFDLHDTIGLYIDVDDYDDDIKRIYDTAMFMWSLECRKEKMGSGKVERV